MLDSLLQSLRRAGDLEYDDEVREAVRRGVERRERVLRSTSKRGGGEEQELARKMLRQSGRWMLRCVGAEEEVEADGAEEDSDTIVVMAR